MSEQATQGPSFTALPNLADATLGALVIHANDEFFAPADRLLERGRGEFIPTKYTPRGKWMDGWESRRRRSEGFDWCVIRLAFPGILRGLDCDTNHFIGKSPRAIALDALYSAVPLDYRTQLSELPWREVAPLSPVKPGSQNFVALAPMAEPVNYVRLRIYPDGGVARLRLYGHVAPNWSILDADTDVDVASLEWGGQVTEAADSFFGPKDNLIMPGRGHVMGDGWETRRKRDPGHDWVVVRLGASTPIRRLEVDTNHFKGNFPDRCLVEAAETQAPSGADVTWQVLLRETRLEAHKNHIFSRELADLGAVNHLRLSIFPDGGVMRLRAFGKGRSR